MGDGLGIPGGIGVCLGVSVGREPGVVSTPSGGPDLTIDSTIFEMRMALSSYQGFFSDSTIAISGRILLWIRGADTRRNLRPASTRLHND